MMDPIVLLEVAVAFLVGFPLVLRVLGAVLPILVTSMANAAQMVAGTARGTMRRSSNLFMEGRSSVGEAVTLSVGSAYHMTEGAAIIWTDLMLAAATVAGLIGLPFSTEGMDFSILLGLSTVFCALVFTESLGNLIGWIKTMPFSSVERGRIPAVILCVIGGISSLLILVALAYYRSQMLAEDLNPATVNNWVNVLPGAILASMAALFMISASLAFTTLDQLFLTIAGSLCFVVAAGLGSVAFIVRVAYLVLNLLLSVVMAVAAWWSQTGMVSEVVSTMSKGFVDRLKELVAVKPARTGQAVAGKPSAEMHPIASISQLADHERAPVNLARTIEVDPEDRELVWAPASNGATFNGHRADHWEFPG